MATNVFFKKGLQSQLDTKMADSSAIWQDGAFYLTTDTQRLYYSNGSKPVQVNPGITTVAAVANLPSANQIKASDYGQFYYCAAENILAIYQGSTAGWVQINAAQDTVIDTHIINATQNTDFVSISDVLYMNNTDFGSGKTISSNIEIEGEHGLVPTVTQKYAQASIFNPNVTYYTRSGSDPDFTYTAVNSPAEANLSNYYIANGYSLNLSAPEYSLTKTVSGTGDSKEATLTLSATGATSSSVTFTPGNNITISEDTNGKIKISASDAAKLSTVAGDENSTSGFDITVTMDDGNAKTGTIDPVIKLGTNTDEYKFATGVATLPVYTKTEVDNKIRDFNAMEYKGTVTPAAISSLLISTTLHNGWVYMLSDETTLHIVDGYIASSGGTSRDATAGDLIVVQGTEVDGVIASPQLVHIPSGNDHDTTYTFTNATHGITITNDASGNEGGLLLAEGSNDWIELTDSVGTASARVVTLTHKTVSVTPTTDSASQTGLTDLEIVVPTATYDDAGHVSAIVNKTYTVTDTHAVIDNTLSVGATDNVATITSNVEVDGAAKTSSITVKSDTLAMSATANALTMNLEWGSF